VASDAGPLAGLRTAPTGTSVEWTNGVGVHVAKALDGTRNTVPRDTGSGQFPGHGIPPGPPLAFIQLRNGSQQVEVTAS
jgi:hypothetical protein